MWTVSWDWKSDVPDQLPWRKTVLKESKPKDKSTMDILNKWMEKGYLIEYDDEKMGVSVGSIPIYGRAQLNKDKIRPVFDFRELNKYNDVYSGSSDVCVEKLREWRRKSNSFAILDLSDAYMQIHVDPAMWRFQSCIINGKKFALTRMGFGLNTAPTIMTEIVRKVLSSDHTINAATGSYVDDIFVDESKVNADEVRCLFKKFGLECKQPERVNDVRKVRVLGVDVKNIDGASCGTDRTEYVSKTYPNRCRNESFILCVGNSLAFTPLRYGYGWRVPSSNELRWGIGIRRWTNLWLRR